MKRTVLLLSSVFIFTAFLVAQQVPRNLVVIEVGTGTWCPYCPAASNGTDELLENGYSVVVIKYHSGDAFANIYSNTRVSYYGITGFPTAFFDGQSPVVGGGNASQTMYPQYSNRVNQRMAVQSSFTLDLEGSHICMTDFTADVTLNKVAFNNSSNLRLHAVLTEKHIPESWQGMPEVNHACRLMVPNQNGTTVSFASGNTQEYSLQFTIDPTWVFENLELVVFLQDHITKEIFQGTKAMLTEFLPEKMYDAGVSRIDSLPEATCSGVFEPRVNIRNYGSEVITNLDIVYYVNNGTPDTYAWSGSLGYLDQESITLPALSFDIEEENVLVAYTMNPNGFVDECPQNDEMELMTPEAVQTPNTVRLFLRTDANPEETTWELTNSSGEVLFSGGPYTVSGQTNQEIFDLEDDDCYTFSIYDDGGDGLQTPGLVMLFYGNNNIIYQGRDFGYSASVEFHASDPTGLPGITSEQFIRVHPNPLKDMGIIELNLSADSDMELTLLNMAGQMIKKLAAGKYIAGSHQVYFNAGDFEPGMYILSARIGDKQVMQKVSIVN
jgi:thiol-disulfide isomerase/thioredoxin